MTVALAIGRLDGQHQSMTNLDTLRQKTMPIEKHIIVITAIRSPSVGIAPINRLAKVT